MLFDLDLTDEQRQQIASIRNEARTASEPYQELLHRTHDEIGQLVHAAAFDESAVRALAVTESKALVELRVIGARAQAAAFAVLTPEQRAALGGRRPPRLPR
jgi:Spy/CpxP family protein refolding chaperone